MKQEGKVKVKDEDIKLKPPKELLAGLMELQNGS